MSHRRWHGGTWGTFPKLFSVLKHVRAHTAELVRPWAEQRGKQWGCTAGSGESELAAEPGALHKETDGFLAHTGCTELSDELCGSQTASSRAERGARKPTLPCRTTGSDSEMKVMSRIFPRCDLYRRSGAQTPGNLHLLQMCRLIRMTQRSRSLGDVIEIKSPAFPPKMCCGCWQLPTATSHLCRQQVWGCGEPAWPLLCSRSCSHGKRQSSPTGLCGAAGIGLLGQGASVEISSTEWLGSRRRVLWGWEICCIMAQGRKY